MRFEEYGCEFAVRGRLSELLLHLNRRLSGAAVSIVPASSSSGMALCRPGEDKRIDTGFLRADERKYQRRRMLKTVTPYESVHPE